MKWLNPHIVHGYITILRCRNVSDTFTDNSLCTHHLCVGPWTITGWPSSLLTKVQKHGLKHHLLLLYLLFNTFHHTIVHFTS